MRSRPRVGTVTRRDGSFVMLRFVETSVPGTFVAVTLDGEQVRVAEGDKVQVDKLGPHQTITFGDPNSKQMTRYEVSFDE